MDLIGLINILQASGTAAISPFFVIGAWMAWRIDRRLIKLEDGHAEIKDAIGELSRRADQRGHTLSEVRKEQRRHQ